MSTHDLVVIVRALLVLGAVVGAGAVFLAWAEREGKR